MSILKQLFKEEEGQDMVEYGLVVSLVVIGGVVTYTAFSTTINTGVASVVASVASAL